MAGVSSCALLVFCTVTTVARCTARSFTIDYENDRFLKDGEPFRYISGTMHYYRVQRPYWRDRMVKMRMAGLNAVQTYVEWSGHEPEPGRFNFHGNHDLQALLDTAMDVGLLVILRVGPFICSERDNGGFPYWLLRLDPKTRCRTSDASFAIAVTKWLGVLLPKVRQYLYENGGPIITVQVENEYGNAGPCDHLYLHKLVSQFRRHLGPRAVLSMTDYPTDQAYQCDLASAPFVTADIPATENMTQMFQIMRRNMKKGPLAVAEYYPGWFDNWGKPHSRLDQRTFLKSLETILLKNASVNVYPFHGGTNFGFGNGAGSLPVTTSYDFGAPLNESGDPTDTYYAIRNLTAQYLPLPNGTVPVPAPKLNLGAVRLTRSCSLTELLEFFRDHGQMKTVTSEYPMSFEDLGQSHGYVAYTTKVKFRPKSPCILAVPSIRDRGYIRTEASHTVLSNDQKIFSAPVIVRKGENITILVENTGRNNGGMCSAKGILGNVTLDCQTLTNWTMEPLPLSIPEATGLLVDAFGVPASAKNQEEHCSAPGAFFGEFVLPEGQPVLDTFLDPTGWGKGVAFVNNFNLGRYWPSVGPQVTLYVPGVVLLPYPQKNTIFLFETEAAPSGNRTVSFVDVPNIDGPSTDCAFGEPKGDDCSSNY